MTDDRKKEYRLLALAVAFFLVGLFFFWYNHASPAPSASQSSGAAQPVLSVQSTPADQLSGPLANFPAPAQFRALTYDGTGLNGSSSLAISAACRATYVAILIFPAAVDYRKGTNAAVYDVAFPCSMGKPFNYVVSPADLGHAPYGSYYFFTVDQTGSGAWYNPT